MTIYARTKSGSLYEFVLRNGQLFLKMGARKYRVLQMTNIVIGQRIEVDYETDSNYPDDFERRRTTPVVWMEVNPGDSVKEAYL